MKPVKRVIFYMKKNGINLAQLKIGSPYIYQLQQSREVKDNIVDQIFSFNVIEVDKFFDILLKDEKIQLSNDYKLYYPEPVFMVNVTEDVNPC